MKVLITTDWYKPVINGVVTSVISLLDGLTALGADVRILTLSKDLHSYKEGNVTYIGSIGVGKIYPNARLKAVPSSKYIQDLIEWHPDIVHSQCEFSTFFLAKKIAEACACPLVSYVPYCLRRVYPLFFSQHLVWQIYGCCIFQTYSCENGFCDCAYREG